MDKMYATLTPASCQARAALVGWRLIGKIQSPQDFWIKTKGITLLELL